MHDEKQAKAADEKQSTLAAEVKELQREYDRDPTEANARRLKAAWELLNKADRKNPRRKTIRFYH